jgi:hypothetical protein
MAAPFSALQNFNSTPYVFCLSPLALKTVLKIDMATLVVLSSKFTFYCRMCSKSRCRLNSLPHPHPHHFTKRPKCTITSIMEARFSTPQKPDSSNLCVPASLLLTSKKCLRSTWQGSPCRNLKNPLPADFMCGKSSCRPHNKNYQSHIIVLSKSSTQ